MPGRDEAHATTNLDATVASRELDALQRRRRCRRPTGSAAADSANECDESQRALSLTATNPRNPIDPPFNIGAAKHCTGTSIAPGPNKFE